MRALRLSWRMQRWELIFLVGGALLIAAAAAIVAWQIPIAYANAMACIERAGTDSAQAACRSEFDWANLLGGASTFLRAAVTVVPFAVGILLGAPLVAGEIEKRTASVAWSLSPSRTWWLAGRALPILVAVVIALLLLGQASEAMILATPDAELGFPTYAMHGPLVAARGLATFGLGVVVGLIMGRVLPAILVTGLLSIALLGALQIGREQLMHAEATWVKADEDGLSDFIMVYDQAFFDDATGELVTYDEASARFPEVFGPEGSWMPPGMTPAYLTTPRERYPVFVAREMAALLAVTVLAGGAGLWVVRWRRPDL
jgi:hypothetical protein